MDNKSRSETMKKAFTMAETLLTIMIIGVLMALMLRAINRVNPDKDKLLFLKSYHAAENAIAYAINDTSKYDDTYYTEAQRLTLTDRHLDFRDDPYPTASVTFTSASGSQVTKSGIKAGQAICYFMADQMNTIGAVNCASNAGIDVGNGTVPGVNFRTSNGVCFSYFSGASNGTKTGKIDPKCEAGGGYEVTVFYDGKMTVPSGAAGSKQRIAYDWLRKQTEIK